MEIDDLKKQWNVLDSRLKQAPLTNPSDIEKLITNCKQHADRGLRSLKSMQRISLSIGAVFIMLLLPTLIAGTALIENPLWEHRVTRLILFLGVSLIGGMVWDGMIYLQLGKIRVDLMPVAEVSHRMNRFRRQTLYEVWACAIWAVAFIVFCYILFDYHERDVAAQLCMVGFLTLWSATLIYLYYKKVVYKHLNNINKDLEELNHVCTE